MFLQDMGTFKHYLVYRPIRRRSSESLIVQGVEQIEEISLENTIIRLINCRTQLSGGWINEYVVYYIGINYMFQLLWPSSG